VVASNGSHRGFLATARNALRSATRFISGGSGYDAVKEKNKRQAPTGLLRSEDAELLPNDRRKLLSGSRDLHRNFSLAAWMIRRHLDYVSSFSFQCRSGNPALDGQVERLMRWFSQPSNCDVTGRFSLAKIVRLAEMRRIVDGDVFLLKLGSGRLQAVEGDRVRTPGTGMPEGFSGADFMHGVKTDDAGKPLAYCVCNRGRVSDASGGTPTFLFERLVDAANMYHFGYFDRFDQVRGVSPMAACLNTLRDTYEGFDYALAKMKVSQLFGLAFYREKSDPVGQPSTSDEDGSGYEVDFGRGPVLLDLDPGDRAEFLESKSPATEFQQFSQTMVSVALKALDIPYSFYAENFTNYSGARQALLQYELSAKIKRADVQALLDHLTAWRIGLWIQDGVLDADIRDIRWNWIPNGIGWIDPLKEIDANIAAIGAGLDTRTRILREQGIDFFELADELEAETLYLVGKNLPPMAQQNRPQIVELPNAA
jgi:capsid protein